MAINEEVDSYLRDLYLRSLNPDEAMPGEPVDETPVFDYRGAAAERPKFEELQTTDAERPEALGSYLSALREAQRQDIATRALSGVLSSAEQIARIQSRGAFQPTGMPSMPSAVSQLEQQQRAVFDYLRQQRDAEQAAVDAEYKRALSARMAQPRMAAKTEEELELLSERAQTERARQEELAARAEKSRREPAIRPVVKVTKPERVSAALTREERIATGLRKEFEAQPAVKSFGDVQAAFGKVSEASKGGSPASDLSMLYSYAKLLDPGSVVRESEFQTMAQTGAFGDKVAAAVKKVAVGERLTEAQRADFVKAARQQLSVYERQFDETAKRYETLAKKSNVAPDDVVFRRTAFVGPSTVKVRRKSDGKVVEVPSTSVDSLLQDGAIEVIP